MFVIIVVTLIAAIIIGYVAFDRSYFPIPIPEAAHWAAIVWVSCLAIYLSYRCIVISIFKKNIKISFVSHNRKRKNGSFVPVKSGIEESYLRQLECIERAPAFDIKSVNLLNGEEVKVFYGCLKAIRNLQSYTDRWHVHAQAAMGEFIHTNTDKVRSTFNAKRVDVLVCDRFGRPVLVVEHQGSGHINPVRLREDVLRNAVKRRVLEKAGIPLLETNEGISAEQAEQAVREKLQSILGIGIDSTPDQYVPKALEEV